MGKIIDIEVIIVRQYMSVSRYRGTRPQQDVRIIFAIERSFCPFESPKDV